MTGTLAPLPYMIKSIRNRDIPVPTAISEFIDNSFAPGKGEASNIQIILEPHRLTIVDDGQGVDDINRLFQLGNHGAALDQDIGEFGVGASIAAINLGDVLHVASVYDARLHRYTVDWERCLNTKWADPYIGLGRPAGRLKGTTLRIDRLRKQIRIPALETGLGSTYAPALEQGRLITIVDDRRHPREVVPIRPVEPPDVVLQPIEGSITVAGRMLRWSGKAGYSPRLTLGRSHVEIAFGHRIIQAVKDPLHGQSRVYARVYLDSDWKPFLSDNKTSIVGHREELFDSITQALQPLLDLAKRENTRMHLKDITADLEDTFRLDNFADQGDTGVPGKRSAPDGEHLGPRPKKGLSPSVRVSHEVRAEPAPNGKAIAPGVGTLAKERPSHGLVIDWLAGVQFIDDGGRDVAGKVDMSDGHVVVYLNEDLPILQDLHAGGGVNLGLTELYLLIATLIAEEFSKNWKAAGVHGTGVKHFPRIMRRVRDLPHDHVFGVVMAEILNATNAIREAHKTN